MKKEFRMPKERTALRMLKRLVVHAKSIGELQELWEIHMELLDNDERHNWLICVFVEYQYSLPKTVSRFPNHIYDK